MTQGVCAQCRRIPHWDEISLEQEHPTCWARRVWNDWSPHQRAEFAGAIQVGLDSMRGAGDGTDARKRRPTQGPN